MPFDSVTIKTYFELEDEYNEEYRSLYRESDYDRILKILTKGKYEWTKSTTNQV